MFSLWPNFADRGRKNVQRYRCRSGATLSRQIRVDWEGSPGVSIPTCLASIKLKKKSYLSTRNKIQTSVCRGGGGGDRPDWAPATEGHFFRFLSKRRLSPSSLHYNTRFQLIDNGWPRVDILLWSFPSQNINVKIKRNHTNAVCLTLSTLYP